MFTHMWNKGRQHTEVVIKNGNLLLIILQLVLNQNIKLSLLLLTFQDFCL